MPLVAGLQKTVDMQSQSVFGHLLTNLELRDLLAAGGAANEHTVIKVLGQRWRACDQRRMSVAERARCIEWAPVLMTAAIAGGALFTPGGGGEKKGRAGCSSGHFQGFAAPGLLQMLGNASAYAALRKRMGDVAWRTFCHRVAAQNDVEGIFGEANDGSATTMAPRMLLPRLDKLEFRDQQAHSTSRLASYTVQASARKKYDAADAHSDEEIRQWSDGAGDDERGAVAVEWRLKQEERAIKAARGQQESARTHNKLGGSSARTIGDAVHSKPGGKK